MDQFDQIQIYKAFKENGIFKFEPLIVYMDTGSSMLKETS